MPGNADYFNDGAPRRKKRIYGKYHSMKVKTEEGKFDSVYEWNRWCYLKELQRNGEITDLKKQVRFQLIPSQIDLDLGIEEEPISYIADFTYMKNGKFIVEDAKGYKTPEYIIKRKLMYYIHKIKIEEV